MLSFKPTVSVSSFTFIKKLFFVHTLNICCLFNPKPSVGLPLSLMSTLMSLFNYLGTSLLLNSLHFYYLTTDSLPKLLFHFLCSFPIKMAPYYHSEFCQFHYKFCEIKMETWFTLHVYYSEHFHWLGKSGMFSKFKGSLICHLCLPNFMM